MKLISTALCLLVSLSLLSCASTSGSEASSVADRPLQQLFRKVNVKDGIDADEAHTLAKVYLLANAGACPVSLAPVKNDLLWVSTVQADGECSALSGKQIAVDSETGEIKMKGYPNSLPPWKDLEKGFVTPR